MSDLSASSVAAGLSFDGTNGSTTMTDWTGRTWTANGNAQLSTAKSKWGASSLLLDGNGDYLTTADSSALEIITNPFTAECWVWIVSLSQIGTIFYKRTNGAENGGWQLTVQTNGNLNFSGVNGASAVIGLTAGNVPTGQWVHLAHTHAGSRVHRIFINGVLTASGTASGDISGNSSSFFVGRSDGFGTGRDFNGYIDEIRITDGVCRYTADFVPPQGPFDRVKQLGTAGAHQRKNFHFYA